jgi:thiamine-phosphate pyrophosphorylase
MADTSLIRLIDASLNRAAEGLRVVEDYVRFGRDDRQLTEAAKSLRHDLTTLGSQIAAADCHAARDTPGDIGVDLMLKNETARRDPWDVCAASFKRVEQALRSLEEFGKLIDTQLAAQIESLRYRVYTLEKATGTSHHSAENLANIDLMILIDRCKSPDAFDQIVAELVEAGVGAIQLRDKNLPDRELLCRARCMCAHTAGTRTVSIVNDRADIAQLAGADGLHLGQDDLTVKDARTIVGTRMLIGVSTHAIAQVRQAVLDGANYLGAGPTFTSQTKQFNHFAGPDYLRQVAAETSLPTFAIGGVTPHNLAEVRSTGITRIAVGRAVTDSANPAAVIQKFREIAQSVE